MRIDLNNAQRSTLDLLTVVGPHEDFRALLMPDGNMRILRPGTDDDTLLFITKADYDDLFHRGCIVATAAFIPEREDDQPMSAFRLPVNATD